jgi:hypothetical protein
MTYQLVNGPQDGGKVKQIGNEMPATVFVGPKWLGDGYVAWGRERCKRFPCRYDWDGANFMFQRSQP